jgi:transposase
MTSSRRRFTSEQKAQVTRSHLANKKTVSVLAEEFGLHPSQIHLWVNLLLTQADKAFERSSGNTRADKARYCHELCFEVCGSGGVSELEHSVGEDLPFEGGEDQGGGIEVAPVPGR